jgi:hypothetical protein
VGGGLLAFLGRNDPSLAAVGDCMKISKVGTRAAATDELTTGTQASQASCSDPLALYKIALKKSGTTGKCAGGDYTPFVQTGLGDDFTLCLGYNVATGDCFEESDTARKKIPCGTAPAEGRFKVVKKVDGVAAASACKGTGKNIFAGLFPLPTPSTLCIAAI